MAKTRTMASDASVLEANHGGTAAAYLPALAILWAYVRDEDAWHHDPVMVLGKLVEKRGRAQAIALCTESPQTAVTEYLPSPQVEGADPEEPPQYSFIRERYEWDIRFADSVPIHPDLASVGAATLAVLLARPNQEIEPVALSRLVDALLGSPEGVASTPVEDGLVARETHAALDYCDVKGLHAIRQRIAELEARLTEARARSDIEDQEDCEEEVKRLREALRKTTDHRGRPRKADPVKQKRDRHRNAIRRFLDAYVDHPLSQHLRKSIRPGGAFFYVPTPPVTWLVNF